MSRVQIGEIITSTESGFACSKNKLVEDGLPHLRPFNISESDHLDLAQVYQVPPPEAPRGKSELLAGDILFNNTNSAELVGKSALVAETMTAGFSNHLTRIRVDRSRVEPTWLAFWLRRLRSTGFFTANATQWVSQAAYRASDLCKLDLELPTLDEQLKIVDLLSRAEGIVRLRREAQKKTEAVVPAMFVQIFGDLSANTKNWKTVSLNEVAEVISGVAKGRKLSLSDMVELPYMRVANVKDGRLDLTEVKMIGIKRSEIARLLIEPGDLLMTEGGDPDKLGRAALWEGQIDQCVHQNHIFKVRSDRSKLVPEYLRALAMSAYGKGYFLRVAKQTTGIASINKTQLSAFPILLPPLELQQQFAKDVAAVESIQRQQQAASKASEATFNALLARSFNARDASCGDTKVVEAEKVAAA